MDIVKVSTDVLIDNKVNWLVKEVLIICNLKPPLLVMIDVILYESILSYEMLNGIVQC